MQTQRADQTQQMPKVMTVKDVAKWLGVSEWTVYAWVAKQQIPHRRVGGKIIFSAAVLARWIEQAE